MRHPPTKISLPNPPAKYARLTVSTRKTYPYPKPIVLNVPPALSLIELMMIPLHAIHALQVLSLVLTHMVSVAAFPASLENTLTNLTPRSASLAQQAVSSHRKSVLAAPASPVTSQPPALRVVPLAMLVSINQTAIHPHVFDAHLALHPDRRLHIAITHPRFVPAHQGLSSHLPVPANSARRGQCRLVVLWFHVHSVLHHPSQTPKEPGADAREAFSYCNLTSISRTVRLARSARSLMVSLVLALHCCM